jgi:para-nitrobenzyl esterase
MKPPRRLVLLAAVLAVAVACHRRREPFHVERADPATKRAPPAGDVVGGMGRYGAHAWLGIPYAQPPVGPLRWRVATPLPRWDGVREALRPSASCVQASSEFGGTGDDRPGEPTGSEDCLTLSIWAPQFAPDAVPTNEARLPVMVWIHGGGNTVGTASFYDGGNLAATHKVIVVAVQYRLGPFGWLRHEALRAGAADAAEQSGNFGTLDLVAALRWVRENVGAFGGDPGNVTIFGESAGGQNVYTMLLAPQARGLFQRAIVESGGVWAMTPADAEHFIDDDEPGHAQSSNEIILRLLEKDGALDRATARAKLEAMPPAEIADWLRSKPAYDVLGAYERPPSGLIDMPRVFRDGVVLPAGDLMRQLAEPDGWNDVPVIVGTNRDENKLFMFTDPQRIRYLLGFLPRFVDEPMYEATAEYLSRMWKVNGADQPAEAMQQSEPAVFVYRFDWDEEPSLLGSDLSKMLGAAHAFEIPFVFGHWDLGRAGSRIFTAENEPGRQALSRAMMSYWVQFASTGNPGKGVGEDLPQWAAWTPSQPAYLVLDTPAGGGVRMLDGKETAERVLADLYADPRLQPIKARCRVMHDLAERGRGYTREEFEAQCKTLPYDQYPWPD